MEIGEKGRKLIVYCNNKPIGECNLENSVELETEKETLPFNKNEYEYYLNRKGVFWFRNIYGRIRFEPNNEDAKTIKEIKYSTILTINYSYG
jgi:hypothetical protein